MSKKIILENYENISPGKIPKKGILKQTSSCERPNDCKIFSTQANIKTFYSMISPDADK